jgi:hypothetical protein
MFHNAARLFSRLHGEKDPRDCILSRVPSQSVCAELGVYKGDFSQLILKTVRPKKLHLMDPWKFERDPTYTQSWYGGEVGKSQFHMDAVYESVRHRFSSAIRSGAVGLHRGTSAECCSRFSDDYFDWIYIDGNHQYEFVKQDLEMYLPKVKPGGLVAGDYDNPGWWQDGVTKAVHEAIVCGRFEKVLIENRQFLLQKI